MKNIEPQSRFGRWTVIGRSTAKSSSGAWFVACRCDCGNIGNVTRSNLMRGASQSCGCLHAELSRERKATHGLSSHRLHATWLNMLARCHNADNPAYDRYGGRGIEVCDRWHSIEHFISDMFSDWREGLTLERRDNSKGYTPDNCYWATRLAQARNRRSNVIITHDGKSQTLFEWAADIGMPPRTLWARIRGRGWTVEQALNTPKGGARLSD